MTTCPTCRGAALEVANEHASRTGCRSYRVAPIPRPVPVPPMPRRRRTDTVPPITAPDGLTPAQWLAREFPV